MITNEAYDITEMILGFAFRLDRGAVVKADYRMYKNGDESTYNSMLNLGVGVWF